MKIEEWIAIYPTCNICNFAWTTEQDSPENRYNYLRCSHPSNECIVISYHKTSRKIDYIDIYEPNQYYVKYSIINENKRNEDSYCLHFCEMRYLNPVSIDIYDFDINQLFSDNFNDIFLI